MSEDCVNWGDSTEDPFSNLNLIGGVDISFPKGDADHACACLVVLTFPELEVGSFPSKGFTLIAVCTTVIP